MCVSRHNGSQYSLMGNYRMSIVPCTCTGSVRVLGWLCVGVRGEREAGRCLAQQCVGQRLLRTAQPCAALRSEAVIPVATVRREDVVSG